VIYFLQAEPGGPIKIGHAVDPSRRRRQLEKHYGRALHALAVIEGDREREREIHRRFAHLRIGITEQFQPAPELVRFISRSWLPAKKSATAEAMPVKTKQKSSAVTLCGSPEYKRALKELAASRGFSVTTLFDQAIRAYARLNQYPKTFPMR
jgi:hypothetical protein